jgi:hypothetical protein
LRSQNRKSTSVARRRHAASSPAGARRPASAWSCPRAECEPRSAANTSKPNASVQLCSTCAPSADDEAIAELRHRVEIAALGGACKGVDGVVVAAGEIVLGG